MQTADVLDALGGLLSQLKAYAAKLPPIVHLTAVPTGVKPKFEAVEEFEEILSRFRTQAAGTVYKTLNPLCVEALEAFEVGAAGLSLRPDGSATQPQHAQACPQDRAFHATSLNRPRKRVVDLRR